MFVFAVGDLVIVISLLVVIVGKDCQKAKSYYKMTAEFGNKNAKLLFDLLSEEVKKGVLI